MAIVMKRDLSDDLWTPPEKSVDIHALQAKDFTKWVRRQVRLFGRRADICNQRYSAVEIWLQELGIAAGFISGGEVTLDGQIIVSGWQAIGYYMFDDGTMEVKAGRWLDICQSEDQEGFLIAR